MRLIANIHKPGAARAGDASADYLTSGVHIDTFAVNGQPMPWNAEAGFTVQSVALPSPLLPRDSVRLSVDWHYDMSKESGREGAIDSTTFFLAYAYPRVSVYDDYNGWDTTPFDDRLEFYNDFNDYDVTVRVPANFVVWGTGTLLNPERGAAAGDPPALPGLADLGADDPRRHGARRCGRAASRRSSR